jgi:hypothetical protein
MKMKRNWPLKILKVLPFVALALAVFTFVVMKLWNWLTPPLFGWHEITYWQALGILVLSKILFGGFRGRPGWGGHWRQRMLERWEQMTPEEREKFREGMRGRCGSFSPPAPEPKS